MTARQSRSSPESDAGASREARELAAMLRAVQLASRGWTTASPNPVVGCLLLGATGEVVGEGWHERPGGPHAEVVALAQAGEAAAGATALVTLEPCRHTGRTGPCADALIAAGVARVVYAVTDPTGQAGSGAEVLREAGVEVVAGVGAAEAEHVNRAWLHSMRTGRPWVVWKFAATLDGRSAAADGTSRWITSSASRADGHLLRSRCDAVMVGVGTVLADDPQLTVRDLPDGHVMPKRQPLRVVLDSSGRTPSTARVRDGAAETVVLTAAQVGSGPHGRGVDLAAVLRRLHGREIRSVLLEGGPRLAGAMLEAGLVDEVVAYLAPALLGQGAAVLLTDTMGSTIEAVQRLEVDDVSRIGDDVRLTGRPRRVVHDRAQAADRHTTSRAPVRW